MEKICRIFCYLLVILSLITVSACEKDDFCTENPVTPSLVLRFYNKDEVNNLKSVNRLSIIALNKTDSLITNQNTDSIAIPLNSLETTTTFTLKINNNDGSIASNKIATLSIQYQPQEEFVSRSCGYRVIFNNATLNTSGWIANISTNSIETISDQTKAHVKIYH